MRGGEAGSDLLPHRALTRGPRRDSSSSRHYCLSSPAWHSGSPPCLCSLLGDLPRLLRVATPGGRRRRITSTSWRRCLLRRGSGWPCVDRRGQTNKCGSSGQGRNCECADVPLGVRLEVGWPAAVALLASRPTAVCDAARGVRASSARSSLPDRRPRAEFVLIEDVEDVTAHATRSTGWGSSSPRVSGRTTGPRS